MQQDSVPGELPVERGALVHIEISTGDINIRCDHAEAAGPQIDRDLLRSILARQAAVLSHLEQLRGNIMALSEQTAAGFAALGQVVGKLDTDLTAAFNQLRQDNTTQRAEVERLTALIDQMEDSDAAEDADFQTRIDTITEIRDNLRSQLDGQDEAIAGALAPISASLVDLGMRLGAQPSPTPPVEDEPVTPTP